MLLVGAAALGCGSPLDSFESAGPRAAVQIPPISLQKVVFEGYHGDLRDLSLTAASAVVDTDTKIAHLTDVAIGFTGDASSGRLEISAPTGDFQLDGDDFTLSGGVSGQTGEGEHFTTAAVHYVGKERKLHSSDPVRIQRSNVDLTGNRMELALDQNKLRILGNVRAKVKPE